MPKEDKWCPECGCFSSAKRFRSFRCGHCVKERGDPLKNAPQFLVDYYNNKKEAEKVKSTTKKVAKKATKKVAKEVTKKVAEKVTKKVAKKVVKKVVAKKAPVVKKAVAKKVVKKVVAKKSFPKNTFVVKAPAKKNKLTIYERQCHIN